MSMFGTIPGGIGAAFNDPGVQERMARWRTRKFSASAAKPQNAVAAVPMGPDANAAVAPGQPLQAAQPMGFNPAALAAVSGAAGGLGGGMMGGIDPNALAQFFSMRQQPQPPVLGMPGYNSLPTRPRNPQREAFMQQLIGRRGRFGGMFGGF